MTITDPVKLSDFEGFLTPEQSAPIFDKVSQTSVVQRLAQQVPLGISGRAIPVFTGEVEASWVGEANEKPKTSGGMELRTIQPKKIAAIHVASSEVVRANPGNYITSMRTKIAEAFAVSFDKATIFGTSSPFDSALSDTNKGPIALGDTAGEDGGVWADLVAGLAELTDDDKELTGWAMSPKAEAILLGSVDANGRPIFVDLPSLDSAPNVRQGRLLGRNAEISKSVHSDGETVLVAGDWSQAAWGVVGGITYKTSTEGTVTIDGNLVSLFENNLVAVLMEAEYGFVLNDENAFITYGVSGS